MSGESRNITDKLECNDGESTGSSDDSRTHSWKNTSKTTSNSDDVSKIAIHSLLVEWKQRGLAAKCIRTRTETAIPPMRRAL